jgi:glycosyltransferase involved in cell wall biosynthesis
MPVDISVVVPMRNESPNVAKLYEELTGVLTGFGRSYEVIAIDDGSTDDTFQQLATVQARDRRWRIIRFRRNFGQTAGFAAGFRYATGRYIVTTDGDLQNDPRDIPGMIALAEERHADIVAGWRKDRKDPFINRRLPSMIANWIISRFTGVYLHDYGCSLKVFKAEVVKPMKLYGEMHRFLPALASEFGASIEEYVVNHRPRVHGQSKYGISRTLRVILDMLTVKFLISYSTRPLQIFGLLGAAMGLMGVLICLYVTYEKFFGTWADRDWTLQAGILLIFTGVQLLMTGLLAEMLARTYHESQDKPIYVIREIREALESSQSDRSHARTPEAINY